MSYSRKRVLHLLSSNKFSGAENVACQIIKIFKDDDMVYCSPQGIIEEQLKSKGIKYISLKKMSVGEVKKIIKIFKPDIIHAHDVKASIIAGLCCKDIPVISHIHCNDKKMSKISIKSVLFYLLSKKFKHIFFVSKGSFNSFKFKDKIKDKSSILYNVINCKSVLDKVNEDKQNYNFDIVFVGRLTQIKNPLRLLDIMKKVVQKNQTIKLAIIGNGEEQDLLQKYVLENSLQDNIKLFGFLNNPYKIIASSKLMLMTSISEGLPMCALEALSLGKPIVSTKTDGLKEVMKVGEIGYFYDTDEDASNYICKIVDEKNNMEQNCLNFSNSFNDLKIYKEKIEKEYTL